MTGVQLELWTSEPERRRQRRDELRRQVFDHYGRACACCGTEDDLTVDHPDGDGAQHRRELFGAQTAGHHFYRWLAKQGFPPGYVVLCALCNRSKATGDRCRLHPTDDRPGQAGPATTTTEG